MHILLLLASTSIWSWDSASFSTCFVNERSHLSNAPSHSTKFQNNQQHWMHADADLSQAPIGQPIMRQRVATRIRSWRQTSRVLLAPRLKSMVSNCMSILSKSHTQDMRMISCLLCHHRQPLPLHLRSLRLQQGYRQQNFRRTFVSWAWMHQNSYVCLVS